MIDALVRCGRAWTIADVAEAIRELERELSSVPDCADLRDELRRART